MPSESVRDLDPADLNTLHSSSSFTGISLSELSDKSTKSLLFAFDDVLGITNSSFLISAELHTQHPIIITIILEIPTVKKKTAYFSL